MHVQQQKTWDESNKLNRLKNSFFLFYHSTVFTKKNSHFEDEINKKKINDKNYTFCPKKIQNKSLRKHQETYDSVFSQTFGSPLLRH